MTFWYFQDVYMKSLANILNNGNVRFLGQLIQEVGLDILSLLFSVISKTLNLLFGKGI